MISHMLFVSIILTSLAGAALAVMLDRRPSCLLVPYAAAALSSALAIIMSLTVLLGHEDFVLSLPTYVQRLGEFSLRVDNLSAYFLLVAAIVTMCVSAYSVGYLREYRGRYSLGRMGFLFNIFVLSLFMVFTAGNAVLFLIVWEIMSVSSYLLVMYEWRKEDSVSSGLLYLVMTHVGTAFIAAAFMLMWTQTGSFDFSSFAGIREMEEVSGSMRSAIFLLLLVGFGTKAGLVPLHIWLPRAHPAAPSNISALTSAIMVKTAVYMIVRCCFGFLGVTEVWWGLLVLLIACISALIGVLYAIVETDIKRVLAYSTVENMGIIFIGIGAAMVFQAFANEGPATSPYLGDIAALALVAALFHVMSHAMFKSLLFMGAGAVISSSHTRNIEEMGGIGRRMRYTGALFLVGALSISAIPPLNGFVGEWMLFQSLFLSQTIGDPMVNILIPAAVAALALTGAMAAACFVRLYGAVFLARPRSDHARKAEEAPRLMLVAMLALAALCVLTGVMVTFIVPVVDDVSASLLGTSIASKMASGITLNIPGGFSYISPLALAAVFLLLLPLIYLAADRLGGPQRVVSGETWDCGTPLGPRNQYTATGHSQPLVRLFGQLVGVRTEVRETASSSPLIPERMTFRQGIEPVFERYLYEPVHRAAVALSNRIGWMQMGSVQAYLAYIFVTLLVLLVVFR